MDNSLFLKDSTFTNLLKNINIFRESKQGVILNIEEVYTLCKSIPSVGKRPKILTKYGLLQKVTKGKYIIANNPIHWKVLADTIIYARKLNAEIMQKYNHKNLKKEKEIVDNNILIRLLKENGISNEELAKYLVNTGEYQVSKKVIIWEEM